MAFTSSFTHEQSGAKFRPPARRSGDFGSRLQTREPLQAAAGKKTASSAFQGFLAPSPVRGQPAASGQPQEGAGVSRVARRPVTGDNDLLEVLREARPGWSEMVLMDAEAKLAEVNILSLQNLADGLKESGHLNKRLRDAGLKTFKAETLGDLRRVTKERLVSLEAEARERVDARRSTVWVDLDGELPSVEGMINQVDLDVDYDEDWSQVFPPARKFGDEKAGSDAESFTREGLINRVDLDEDYDTDWCYQTSTVERRENAAEPVVELPVKVPACVKMSSVEWRERADESVVEIDAEAPSCGKEAARRGGWTSFTKQLEARQPNKAGELMRAQEPPQEAAVARGPREPAVPSGFTEWLDTQEARISQRRRAIEDREPNGGSSKGSPAGGPGIMSFSAWLDSLEKLDDVPGHSKPDARPALPVQPSMDPSPVAAPGSDETIPALDQLLKTIDLDEQEEPSTSRQKHMPSTAPRAMSVVQVELEAWERLQKRLQTEACGVVTD